MHMAKEESARKSESSDADHSQIFDDEEQLKISFVSDGQRSSSIGISKARHVDVGDKERSRDQKTRGNDGGSKFRAAARKVQAVAKVFSTSQQVRDAVYQEWLDRKSTAVKKSERLQHEERMKEEADRKRKATARAKRSKRTVQEWHEQKNSELIEKQKQIKEQAKEKQREEESERDRKRCESDVVYHQWKRQKTKLLLEQCRRRKREEERVKENKEEEVGERVEVSRKVIQTWSQRKDEVMKENASQVWKERKQRRKSEAAQRFMKTAEADKAYNTWLAKKDLETRDKTRAVMISDTPRPTWCPARTLHSVPSHRLSRIQTSRKKSLSSLRAQHSYSLDSFAGSESVSSATSEGGSEAELSRASSSGQDNAAHSTGTLKTVQVCCKTLKYWCNCD